MYVCTFNRVFDLTVVNAFQFLNLTGCGICWICQDDQMTDRSEWGESLLYSCWFQLPVVH